MDIGPFQAAHGVNSSMNAASVPDSQHEKHEKQMLAMALEKSPGHIPVLLKLALIESAEGQLQDAAKHLRELLRAEPDNPEANLELGKVLFRLGDIRGAIEHTGAILKTHPNYEDALYNMGAIYANIGNRKGAMDYWNRLAALHSNSESAQKAQQMMTRLSSVNP